MIEYSDLLRHQRFHQPEPLIGGSTWRRKLPLHCDGRGSTLLLYGAVYVDLGAGFKTLYSIQSMQFIYLTKFYSISGLLLTSTYILYKFSNIFFIVDVVIGHVESSGFE